MPIPPESAHAVAALDGLVLAFDPLPEHRANHLLLLVSRPLPVDRPAVVRIDQVEAPALVALVDVRHAGTRELEQRLRQRDLRAERGQSPREPRQRLVLLPRELLHAPLVLEIRLEPGRAQLALAQRLLE